MRFQRAEKRVIQRFVDAMYDGKMQVVMEQCYPIPPYEVIRTVENPLLLQAKLLNMPVDVYEAYIRWEAAGFRCMETNCVFQVFKDLQEFKPGQMYCENHGG